MKQIKNATLAILGGLLILSVATVSCSKKSGGGSTASTVPTISAINPSTGDTLGEAIQIVGTNFAGASVTIGGIAATNVSIAATVINATIPAGVAYGTVIVKVTTAAGSASFNITVVNPSTLFQTADGKNSSNQVETSSIIAHWTFDGSLAESATGNTPQLTGGSNSFVTGRIGQAVHLTNGWLTYPSTATAASSDNQGVNNSNDTLQNGFTISLWEEVDSVDLLSSLFQLSNVGVAQWPLAGIQYRRHFDSTIDLDGGISNVDGTGTHPTYAGAFGPASQKDNATWALITMVYDSSSATGGTLVYYFNGVQVGTPVGVSGAFPALPQVLLQVAPNYATIGSPEGNGPTPGDTNPSNIIGSNPGNNYFQEGITGNIDDVRFYKKSLTATDILDLYQLGVHGQ
jgi:uncharacterized protein (TIGR03437 family)